jgi:hypothetical protein
MYLRTEPCTQGKRMFPKVYKNMLFLSDFNGQNLAELLYYLLKNCFPTRLDIFSMADHVITRLQQDDPLLFDHLTSRMQRNVIFDPREFLVNFMHKERKRASEMEKSLEEHQVHSLGDDKMTSDARSLLSHPIIFIRKWVGEVSIATYSFIYQIDLSIFAPMTVNNGFKLRLG